MFLLWTGHETFWTVRNIRGRSRNVRDGHETFVDGPQTFVDGHETERTLRVESTRGLEKLETLSDRRMS